MLIIEVLHSTSGRVSRYYGVLKIDEVSGSVQWELIQRICNKKCLGGSITTRRLDYKNEKLYFDNTVKYGSYAYHSEAFGCRPRILSLL